MLWFDLFNTSSPLIILASQSYLTVSARSVTILKEPCHPISKLSKSQLHLLNSRPRNQKGALSWLILHCIIASKCFAGSLTVERERFSRSKVGSCRGQGGTTVKMGLKKSIHQLWKQASVLGSLLTAAWHTTRII